MPHTPYIYHYNAASTHPNNTVISGALVNNMSQWSISLSDEPSGGVSAYMHIQADTNLEAQEVGFELDLPENVYADMRVMQFVDTGEEYINAVAWTSITTSGAQSFMVPINKAYVKAGGPTMLQMTFRTVGNVNLGTGTATQWKNYYTYLSHYVSQTHIATICEEKDNYRFGFNGKEKDNEAKGIGNSLDFGARMHDTRVARFLSTDRLASKFPHYSPYLFAGNSPIQAIDYNGDHIYILTHVGGYDHGDDMFKAAALTRKFDIEHSPGFNSKTDKVVVLQVKDLGDIKKQVNQTVKAFSGTYGGTKEFGIWSHAGFDGPVGTSEATNEPLYSGSTQMSIKGWGDINFNWSTDAKNTAGFYGCNTGKIGSDGSSFTTKLSALSNFKDVNLLGQTSSAFPSQYTNERDVTFSQLTDDFLPVEEENYHYNHGDPGPAAPTVRKTYMVGGNSSKGAAAFFGGEKANTMRESKNGVGTAAPNQYQPGDVK